MLRSVKALQATNSRKTFNDFDGDGKSDFAVWRSANGTWHVNNSKDGSASVVPWGAQSLGDIPVPADYDGDGRTDFAVYRPVGSRGIWYILPSSAPPGTHREEVFGDVDPGSLEDTPVPADYDGDGRTDVAVRRENLYGPDEWWIKSSRTGVASVQAWDIYGKPVQGDYDGDGRTDIATYSPGVGEWHILASSTGIVSVTKWGGFTEGDIPVPGDYDGDGRTDVAVFRPTTSPAGWWIKNSGDGSEILNKPWGSYHHGDVAAPGDYDGDGRTDLAVWRSNDGRWHVWRSSTDSGQPGVAWGRSILATYRFNQPDRMYWRSRGRTRKRSTASITTATIPG